MTEYLESFAPELTQRIRVLVLGSMPGIQSLKEGRYYAHSRNRFWPVVSQVLELSATAPYPERVQALADTGVGVWDVIRSCRRQGSLDSSIVPGSEVLNDFSELLRVYPNIRAFAFNGQKAFHLFEKDITPGLASPSPVALLALPSTSPANASWSVSRLVSRWRQIRDYLDETGPSSTQAGC